jgi:N-acetylmuramoyl-L-alanine amidase
MTAVWLAVLLASGGGADIDLEELANRYGLSRVSDAATGREVLRGQGLVLVVAPGLSTALWNGEARALSREVRVANGRVVVPVDVERLFAGRPVRPASPPAEATARPARESVPRFKVAIDAGHGGVHTGGKGRGGLLEKEVSLDVALRLAKLLQQHGVEVFLTRDTDTHFAEYVNDDLDMRAAAVNRARPDVFMSIHTNWHSRREARGWEVYVPQPLERSRGEGTRELAQLVASEFRKLDTEDRGIKEAGFRVLRGTKVPAVLVELEFISNPRGERELGDTEHRQKLAGMLFEALRRYIAQR